MPIRLALRLTLLVLVVATVVVTADAGRARAQVGTTVELDTYRQNNTSPIEVTGPFLEQDQPYTITVTGTFSYWFASDWQNQGVCTGATPEDAPMFPSPGTTNGKVGDDAAWHFAGPNTYSDCGGPFPDESTSLEISVDGGDDFFDLDVDDPGTAPNPSHTYHFLVIGDGDDLVFSFSDQKTVDNYGIFKFTTESVTWGDNSCSGGITALDALPVLEHGFGSAVPVGDDGCSEIGGNVEAAGYGTLHWGDIDCSGQFDAPDVLLILRYVADLPAANPQNCPDLGSTLALRPI